ncbi:MAG: SCO family protein [Gammaproteobacteria bacterium]|nr:SCO family protein [Gammaproteobacteria bacterium]
MKKFFTGLVLCGVLLAGPGCDRDTDRDSYLSGSHAARAEVRIMADGWKASLPYEVPKPGSYALPRVGVAGGGSVLGPDGKELELGELMGDKIVLLTFIYSSCTDFNGCPLATAVFYKVKERFKDDPELAKTIRLISVSFDPEHDTPEVMRLYGEGFEDGDPQWLFLTTASEETLGPIIRQYGQMVIKEYDESGKYKGTMAHVLRAFLIDRSKNIRQEYSVSFLHDQLVTVDIKTLLIEEGVLPGRIDS